MRKLFFCILLGAVMLLVSAPAHAGHYSFGFGLGVGPASYLAPPPYCPAPYYYGYGRPYFIYSPPHIYYSYRDGVYYPYGGPHFKYYNKWWADREKYGPRYRRGDWNRGYYHYRR